VTLALYGGEWSASRSGRFTPRERANVNFVVFVVSASPNIIR